MLRNAKTNNNNSFSGLRSVCIMFSQLCDSFNSKLTLETFCWRAGDELTALLYSIHTSSFVYIMQLFWPNRSSVSQQPESSCHVRNTPTYCSTWRFQFSLWCVLMPWHTYRWQIKGQWLYVDSIWTQNEGRSFEEGRSSLQRHLTLCFPLIRLRLFNGRSSRLEAPDNQTNNCFLIWPKN